MIDYIVFSLRGIVMTETCFSNTCKLILHMYTQVVFAINKQKQGKEKRNKLSHHGVVVKALRIIPAVTRLTVCCRCLVRMQSVWTRVRCIGAEHRSVCSKSDICFKTEVASNVIDVSDVDSYNEFRWENSGRRGMNSFIQFVLFKTF